jgi:hydroxymethylpyrimidine/phosphomethylpyrimidine kinase
VALTIAGSDPSGGAGIQADVKTFAAFGVYGAAVVTALTAQNTCGVRATLGVPADFVAAQIDAVLDDLAPGAVKTGMLGGADVVRAVARALGRARHVPLVVDPVLVATSGDALGDSSTLPALVAELVPVAFLVTPNADEAEALTGRRTRTRAEMADAARALVAMGAHAALVTGGHATDSACDVLFADGVVTELDAPRVPVASSHGTGCTLSAAIAAGIARGEALGPAVARAKRYVRQALLHAPAVGRGHRPLEHHLDPDDDG